MKGNKYGTHRVLVPRGVLPQPADKLDNDMSYIYDNEILCDVDTLNVDSASFKVILDKGAFEQNLQDIIVGSETRRFQFYFIPPLLEFQGVIEGRGMPQTHEHILEKTAVFLAGFKSLYRLDGRPALLSELEDDFTVRSDPDPITYPDGMFR